MTARAERRSDRIVAREAVLMDLAREVERRQANVANGAGEVRPVSALRHPCSRCLEERFLLAPIGDELLCSGCWDRAGRLFPRFQAQTYEQADAIQRQMTARGGTGRHMVRNGRT